MLLYSYKFSVFNLHGLHVIAHVEVGVAQLAVDGAQRPEVVGSGLKNNSEELESIL
jgi:hypothetical protein